LFTGIVLFRKNSYIHTRTWVGMLIYAGTLLLLYTSSTLYHHVPKSDAKRIFRLLDHANIYLLIAGTYSPILLFIGNPGSIRVLYIVWSVALVGILFSLIFWGKLKILHVLFYLAMGWMMVLFWSDIVPYIPSGLLFWILAAGLTYTIGVIFYAKKDVPHNHMIWHLLCIVASALFCIGFLIHLH
ncbi:MAG: hemolysin III family protein, partial [Sphaerochaetaceae bacterium]